MIRSIQSLRFIFILLIVCSHIFGRSFDFGGECGVVFFFVISGFVMSWAYGNRIEAGTFSSRELLCRQLRKVYPLHLTMALVALAWLLLIRQTPPLPAIVLNLLLLQSWVPDPAYYFSLNGVAWFLSDIFFCYFCFARLYRLVTRLSMRILTCVIALLVVAYLLVACYLIPLDRVNDLLYVFPLTRLIDFALGIVLCRIVRHFETAQNASLATIKNHSNQIEAAILLTMIASFFLYDISPTWFRCAALFWPLALPILFYFILSERHSHGGFLSRLLHTRPMQYLGSISLQIFLIHLLVLNIINHLLRYFC